MTRKPDNTSEKCPYVRYRISSEDTKDVGIGIAVKRAIDSFVNNHGYESKVTIAEKTSNRFEIILQIFEGGNPDLMVTALREHISNSGRLPSNRKYKPDVKIEPIPCSEGVRIIQESGDQIAFQKEREDYQRRLDEKEREVEDITRVIGARQKVIDRQLNEIKTLETALEGPIITKYTDPFDLLANTYLPKSIEDLVEASDDWEIILKSKDETLFTSNAQEQEINFLIYLNKKYGLKFKSEEEFDKWKIRLSSAKSWQETPEAKELTGTITQIDTDLNLYEIAKSSGASEETLRFLEGTVEKNRQRSKELRQNSTLQSKEFEESRKAYELIALQDPKKSYTGLMKVLGNSDARSRKKSEFPILATTKPGSENKILRFYMPVFDHECSLEQHLYSLIQTSIKPEGTYTLSQIDYNEQIRILDAEAKPGNKLGLDYSRILNDSILNALGLKPKIITIKTLE